MNNSNLYCEKLAQFKQTIAPHIHAITSQTAEITRLIINQYVTFVDEGNSTQEERNFLAELRHHNEAIIYSTTHSMDMLETIGTPKTVERYINFVDGEAVEVDKEHFLGLPDDE